MALEDYMGDENAKMPKWFTDKYGDSPEAQERFYKLMERNPEAVGRTEEGPEGNTAMGQYFDEEGREDLSEDQPDERLDDVDTSQMSPEELKEHRKAKIRARNEAEAGENTASSDDPMRLDDVPEQDYYENNSSTGQDEGRTVGRGDDRRAAQQARRDARREGRGGERGRAIGQMRDMSMRGGRGMERWGAMLEDGGSAAERMDPERLAQVRERFRGRGGQGNWGDGPNPGDNQGGPAEGGVDTGIAAYQTADEPAEQVNTPGGRNARNQRPPSTPPGEPQVSFSETMEEAATLSERPASQPYAREDAVSETAPETGERKKKKKKKRGEADEYEPENQNY